MWDWLLSGTPQKPKSKHLHELLERLLSDPERRGGDHQFALQEKELKRLCSATREVLLKDPSLLEITSTSDVVVVGDLHGQFWDLQRIFEQLGRPGSDDKVWVFLGDYIDRGPMGLEIVATLFALKLLYPANIHLLRGNHECSEITVLFGFCGECQRRSTLAVWEAVMQVFDALPLAALLNNKVFLCHGGISPYMQRPQDVNTIKRPLDVSPSGEGMLSDLLWADPSPHVNGWVSNPRGVSFIFGLDVAQQWLHSQGLRAIIRAHMVQQDGFEVLGNNEIMTVFSAADYRDSGNTGAVLVIEPSLDFEFVTFAPMRRDSEVLTAGAGQEQDALGKFSSPKLPPMPVIPECNLVSAATAELPALEVPTGLMAPESAAAAAVAADTLTAGEQAAGAPTGPAAGVSAGEEPATPPGAAATKASQALQQEVEEENVLIHRALPELVTQASMTRRGSLGMLSQLEQKMGGERVHAEALARLSPTRASSPRLPDHTQ